MSYNVVDLLNLDMTGGKDNAPALAQLASFIAGLYAQKKALPRLVFSEGDLAFSAWPDLAYDNLEIVAEGECRLKPQGNCPVVFDGSLRNPIAALPTNNFQPGINGLLFHGFHIWTDALTAPTALSFRGIHRSRLKAEVVMFNSPHTNRAMELIFCVLADLTPRVSAGGQTATGLYLDAWPGKPALQTTASVIHSPCLEGLAVGLDLQNAGSCSFYDGTIESCKLGVHLGSGAGNNTFYSVEMEGNSDKDVIADGGAHGNHLLYCGNSGKLHTNFQWFDPNWATQ